ncbi:MAG: hypothetical protein KIT84_25765 [Labilithrix sp.]|nr:hypothetical protein [Labilithrix sp.]MCW5814461.1 hypothetical protein [Labilithrix sp.]
MTRAFGLVMLVMLVACGTTGDAGGDEAILPSAGMGPFRPLAEKELKGAAPFVLDDSLARYADPAVLADGESTLLYAVTQGKIVRTRANDGRTFFGAGQVGRAPAVVLAPTEPWEIALAGPFALRRGAEVWLYYAGEEGIGVARSSDGLAFTKEPGPIVWGGAAPSVFALPDGSLRMLYTRGLEIEEAASPDGLAWQRIGPVFSASHVAGAFDAVAVADPWAEPRTTAAGRFHVRVLYTGTDEAGATAIGFAGRYGVDGPLTRNPDPAYPAGRQPALLGAFLYVTQERPGYDAIAAALQPRAATLTPPGDYPASP